MYVVNKIRIYTISYEIHGILSLFYTDTLYMDHICDIPNTFCRYTCEQLFKKTVKLNMNFRMSKEIEISPDRVFYFPV